MPGAAPVFRATGAGSGGVMIRQTGCCGCVTLQARGPDSGIEQGGQRGFLFADSIR